MTWTLEVVVVPESDVDRAKASYEEKLGFATSDQRLQTMVVPYRRRDASDRPRVVATNIVSRDGPRRHLAGQASWRDRSGKRSSPPGTSWWTSRGRTRRRSR
jgi:hypothetical protein